MEATLGQRSEISVEMEKQQFAGDFVIHRVAILEFVQLAQRAMADNSEGRALYRFINPGNTRAIFGSHTTYGLGHEAIVFVNTLLNLNLPSCDRRLVMHSQEDIGKSAQIIKRAIVNEVLTVDLLEKYLTGVECLYDYLESLLPIEGIQARCEQGLTKAYQVLELGIDPRSGEPLKGSETRQLNMKIMGYRLALIRAAHRANQQG